MTEETWKNVGGDLQFLVDCSRPGDTILCDIESVMPKTTMIIKHSMAFGVSNSGSSKVVVMCPSAGMIFDIQ